MAENYFDQLYQINVNDKTEKKGGLTYLSWAWAWAEVKKLHPDATYKIYENDLGWNYHTDNNTCWVKTGVTVNGIEHIEYLPVMDHKNKSIPLEKVTSFDVNKSIQRSLTKACARHGLGLYVFAGEDLPEKDDGASEATERKDSPITKKQEDKLVQLLDSKRKSVDKFCEYVGISALSDLTREQYAKALISKWDEVKDMVSGAKKGEAT